MKPYLVQRTKYTPGVGRTPDPENPPVFVAAPGPLAAARKAGALREVHGGRGCAVVRVTALVDLSSPSTYAYRDYRVDLETAVARVEPA